MSELSQKIQALDFLSRRILLREIFDKGVEKSLFALVSRWNDTDRQAFLSGFGVNEVQWLEEIIREARNRQIEEPSEEKIVRDILASLKQVIEVMEQETKQSSERIVINRGLLKECVSGKNDISDQMRGAPIPPPQKEVRPGSRIIDLPMPDSSLLTKPDIMTCIRERKSYRKFSDQALSLKELAYLVWATQGVRQVLQGGKVSFRMVPSGGARHPFETYLAINRVETLRPGVYRYLPFEHKLVYLFTRKNLPERLNKAALDQTFVGDSAVVFIWSAIPYRSEWRYTFAAHKAILLDAGHVCQNLYLACESISCGTCAIAAYSQSLTDELLGLDGSEEFAIYMSPVGKLLPRQS